MSDHERPDVEGLRRGWPDTTVVHAVATYALRLERELAEARGHSKWHRDRGNRLAQTLRSIGKLAVRPGVAGIWHTDDAKQAAQAITHLHAERDAAREALRSLRARCAEVLGKTYDHRDYCTFCASNRSFAEHAPDCTLAALLAEVAGE